MSASIGKIFGIFAGTALALGAMLPATATADTGARTEAQVVQECGDDSLCLYRLPYFHDQLIEVERPPAGRCYNLPGGEHARSVLNDTYAYVECSAVSTVKTPIHDQSVVGSSRSPTRPLIDRFHSGDRREIDPGSSGSTVALKGIAVRCDIGNAIAGGITSCQRNA